MKRIAILDEDGTTEIGGVRYKLVPEEALQWLHGEGEEFECPPERYFRGEVPAYWWRSVFREKAAKPDLSALPVVPQYKGSFSHVTLRQSGWNAALAAIGVRP